METTVRKLERGYVRDVPGGWLHLANKDDTTPHHLTYPTGYDATCGWCWLGAGHTVAAHSDRIGTNGMHAFIAPERGPWRS